MSSRTKFFNSHPQDGALAEIPDGRPCWSLTAKIAKGTADGLLVLDMTHACDVLRVYGDQLSPTLQARMGTEGNQVPLVCPLDVRNAVRHTRDMTQGVGIETSFPKWQEEKPAPVTVGHQQGVAEDGRIRRLTPKECERLQGFPDDWTLITFRKRPAADGPRYRAIGNSWAVPVIRWIGRRMDKWLKERE